MQPKKVNKLKYPIPEDFELSDDEPKMINLSKEQKLTRKNNIWLSIMLWKITVEKWNRNKPQRHNLSL